MLIGVVGINYKLADLKLREELAKTCLKLFGSKNSVQPPHTFIILSTCNRTEVYFTSEDLPTTHTYILAILRENIADDFDQKLYSYFSQDCLLHLCRVTAGLDSAIVAETEIQGQVKGAYEQAAEFSSLPEELHYLFQKALKTGKQVRSQLLIQRGLPDLEHAVLQTGINFSPSSASPKVLFVGTSEINRKILDFFKHKQINDITICNRTEMLANEVGSTYNCDVLKWQHLQQCWYSYDWIILGTKAPEPIITATSLPTDSLQKNLLIDLSVPRNVDAALAEDPRITLVNIDELDKTLLSRRNQMQHILAQAENLIDNAAKQYTETFKLRQKSREMWLAAV